MANFDNTNRWSLFKNDSPKSEKSPPYSGTLNVNGEEFYINGWVREGAKGKFFSGTIKPKEERRSRGSQTVISGRQGSVLADDDSDIPF